MVKIVQADNLILINVKSVNEKEYYFSNPTFKVHYQNSSFLIASTTANLKSNMVLLDKDAWQEGENYSIVYVDKAIKSNYLNSLGSHVLNCYQNDKLVILKHYKPIAPAKTDGMIRILPNQIKLHSTTQKKLPNINITEADPFVDSLIDQISQTNLENNIRHMQNYGTRIYDTPEAAETELWIKEQFELLGLEVFTQDINYEGSSKNVLAIQEGTLMPDEYILCGAHYDSYAWGDSAPGADDNASGTAGVLEIARILSQYSFDRSIIYCAWTAEEIGLVGSQYYVNMASQQGINILGYFNLDMIGYQAPDSDFHIDLIYTEESEFLGNFYAEICNVYLPDVTVERDFLSGGSSDHAAFNMYGFMGIFPFENIPNYSPYIHSDEDIIGLSVNNFDMAERFVAASLASVAILTGLTLPPQNFSAIAENKRVTLNWNASAGISKYNIYRNNEFLAEVDGSKKSYIDNDVENETTYTYKINCISSKTGEESDFTSSKTVIPMPDLVLPYTNNFDDNINYWIAEGDWNITTEAGASGNTSLTDSPNGNYKSNTNTAVTMRNFNIPNTFSAASVNFKVKHSLELNFDYVVFEIVTENFNYTLEIFNGEQNTWREVSYSLDDFIGMNNLQLRFHMMSDPAFEMDGIYIDDFSINEQAVSVHNNESDLNIKLFPNPAKNKLTVTGCKMEQIDIYALNGKLIEQIPVQMNNCNVDLSLYEKGIYLMQIKTGQTKFFRRFIKD